jgi:hypothetical protein
MHTYFYKYTEKSFITYKNELKPDIYDNNV